MAAGVSGVYFPQILWQSLEVPTPIPGAAAQELSVCFAVSRALCLGSALSKPVSNHWGTWLGVPRGCACWLGLLPVQEENDADPWVG